MKKSLRFLCIAMLCTTATFAQNKFSAYTGINLSHFKHRYIDANKQPQHRSKLGFNLGFKMNLWLDDKLSIETGLGLSMKGSGINLSKTYTQENNISDGYIRSTLYYLDLPIVAKFHIGSIHLFTGPYIGINLGGKRKYDYTIDYLNPNTEDEVERGSTKIVARNSAPKNTNDQLYFKTFDYGIINGLGVELGKVDLRLAYYYGLVNVNLQVPYNDEVQDKYRITNRMLSLTVLYKLGKAKRTNE